MDVRIVPFHSGSIVPALHYGAPCDTCRPVQVNVRRRMTAASEPLRSYFCAFFKGSDSRGFLSLHLFYAWDIVACRLSGTKRDCAMRTLAKSQTCEVYCVSGHGRSGCSPAQVNHHCFRCASKTLPKGPLLSARTFLSDYSYHIAKFVSLFNFFCNIKRTVNNQFLLHLVIHGSS